MAHFALIDKNNIVKEVIVLDNSVCGEPELSFPETEKLGQDFIKNILNKSGKWLQTSFNHNFRGRYAWVDYPYDPENDVFISPETYIGDALTVKQLNEIASE